MTKEIQYKVLEDGKLQTRVFARAAPFLLGSGIPDKEGKEIFEGDRVFAPDSEENFTVRFKEFYHRGMTYNGWFLESEKILYPLSSKDSKYLKIVGNKLTDKK